MHDAPQDEPMVDGDREWAIYRCGHGCLHVSLDRLMLTLTDDEFHALQELMRRACQRFHQGAAGHALVAGAH
jgi:hypothetical protein